MSRISHNYKKKLIKKNIKTNHIIPKLYPPSGVEGKRSATDTGCELKLETKLREVLSCTITGIYKGL